MMRIEQSYVFPIIFAVLLWAGLYLRDPHLRALVPLKRIISTTSTESQSLPRS